MPRTSSKKKSSDNKTPHSDKLFEAVSKRKLSDLQKLLKENPDSDLTVLNKDGVTLLMEAVLRNHEQGVEDLKCIEELLKAGANPNQLMISQSREWTVLLCAIQYGHLETCRLLLEGRGKTKADPNLSLSSTSSPLHYAAALAKPAFCELLIQHGADPNQICADGTPLFVTMQQLQDKLEDGLNESPTRQGH